MRMRSHAWAWAGRLPAVSAAVMLPVVASAAAGTSIPGGGKTVLPVFTGHAARPQSAPAHRPPQNPFLAPNPFSNAHNDAWMSDAYAIPGSLGRHPAVMSSTLRPARTTPSPFFLCVGVTFDSHGRLETVCFGREEQKLVLIDPVSLKPLAWLALPPPPPPPSSSFSAAYFYLDNRDRAVVATRTNHILVMAQAGPVAYPRFQVVADYSESRLVGTDTINAVVPDWSGRLWFVTQDTGMVGVLNPATGHVHSIRLNQEIANSFAMTSTGAYVVTNNAQYRLAAGPNGVPHVVWSAPYQNIGTTKPGQLAPGSGTTPTILGGGKYVAIADNAAQMHVVVYRTAARMAPGQHRIVCQVPVFAPGAGATENSLIGSGRSIIVENNYGYQLNSQTLRSTMSVPGVARVDIAVNGKGCRLVWTNTKVAPPSLVPKLSTATSLVYFYVKHQDPWTDVDVWYWAAVNFRTGKLVWERRSGTGPLYNNSYSGLAIGPTGTAYLGGLGGMMAIKDTAGPTPVPVTG